MPVHRCDWPTYQHACNEVSFLLLLDGFYLHLPRTGLLLLGASAATFVVPLFWLHLPFRSVYTLSLLLYSHFLICYLLLLLSLPSFSSPFSSSPSFLPSHRHPLYYGASLIFNPFPPRQPPSSPAIAAFLFVLALRPSLPTRPTPVNALPANRRVFGFEHPRHHFV